MQECATSDNYSDMCQFMYTMQVKADSVHAKWAAAGPVVTPTESNGTASNGTNGSTTTSGSNSGSSTDAATAATALTQQLDTEPTTEQQSVSN
jgi:hypothetical protein